MPYFIITGPAVYLLHRLDQVSLTAEEDEALGAAGPGISPQLRHKMEAHS